ncbi:MAG: DegT/DnrJ/EryC1/StrS family aminotransferase [Treponema sp.]
MRIPVYSSTIRRSEMDAVLTCMVEEKIGPGEANQKLIKLIRDMYLAESAFAFRSPAIALYYVLKALDLPEKTGIMVSALAPKWQYLEILKQGFIPIVLDVDPASLLVSLSAVGEGIKKGGGVLILHETLGSLNTIESLAELGIPLIEDISQSAGAVYGETKAGCFGDFTILGLEERDILTAGGGAVLFSTDKKKCTVLKNIVSNAPITDFLPDINAALAAIQVKNMDKNIQLRTEIYDSYIQALFQAKHKTLLFPENFKAPIYSFPVILENSVKEVKNYANRKEIDVEFAFEDSIISYLGEEAACTCAASLALRTVLFPLYPRLGIKNTVKISKVLGSLP